MLKMLLLNASLPDRLKLPLKSRNDFFAFLFVFQRSLSFASLFIQLFLKALKLFELKMLVVLAAF
jgi:hypothetical protein